MALVAFVRGANVGGHRTFRPSVLATHLSRYDVVSIGAAGTFVVRRPGRAGEFRAALQRKLPFVAEVVLCAGRDLVALVTTPLFRGEPPPGCVRFVTVLATAGRSRPSLPIALPPGREWLVRLVACEGRFVFGMYRRDMRTIGGLGQLDRLFGVPTTTRNWNTMLAVARVLSRDGA